MISFRWLSACFLLASVTSVNAQHFALSRLFYPNVTLKADYAVPSSLNGTQDFGMTRTGFLGIIPVQSEVQLGYSLKKKFDLRAVHTVMLAQYNQIQPTVEGKNSPENGYKTLSLGVIRLQASIKDRLWVYGGGLGITETNETFFSPQPFFWGGAARMHILGLRTQIMYGSVLTYNQKLRFIPVLGVNKGLGKHWRASALLPFMANVNYKATKWFNVDMLAGLNGYSGGFQVQTPEEKKLMRENYRHIKTGISANAHLFTALNISLEAGVSTFRQLRTFNSARQNLSSENPAVTPYIGASVRYITSRSKLSSKFTRRMGLGQSGVNW
ncbi:hypothetical protein FEM33_06100 [Dyadobacter flavalbus]|uniref:Outer membrane beta-barrel protein n=1 Tax=Dyadobacter flavalbus TaxID=2579942 RepID=A0A5M8QV88_9BACT|nr:DUF6268 family outer membrane beta-barrel protein [Dyadobacter flavalbus]KAA6440177.1 hypothetical protein FEM33_06100 [Dyadobacter flavalbus]